MTATLLVNLVLAIGLIGALLLLLGLPGIRRDRHHRAHLHGWHRDRANRGAKRPRHVADV